MYYPMIKLSWTIFWIHNFMNFLQCFLNSFKYNIVKFHYFLRSSKHSNRYSNMWEKNILGYTEYSTPKKKKKKHNLSYWHSVDLIPKPMDGGLIWLSNLTSSIQKFKEFYPKWRDKVQTISWNFLFTSPTFNLIFFSNFNYMHT